MNRRDALTWSAAGLAAAIWPEWLARGFAQDAQPKLDDLHRAIERARSLGKPLVVIVVPEDWEKWEDRLHNEQLISAALRSGDDELYADLALAEFLCARTSDLLDRFPNLAMQPAPQFVLVTPDAAGEEAAEAHRVAVSPSFAERADEGSERAWSAPLAVQLRSALAGRALMGDLAKLEQRARAARASLDAEALEAVELALASQLEPTAALAARAAGMFRFATRRFDAARATFVPRLAAAARARLWSAPPPGARWAKELGCFDYELEPGQVKPVGEQDSYEPSHAGVSCGIGHTPPASRRFLYFLTKVD